MNASDTTITLPATKTTTATATAKIISYTLATDGACSGNPGPGGWGAAIIANSADDSWVLHETAGGEADTTNNRMELTAAIEGLKTLIGLRDFDPGCHINVRSDSQYVVSGVTKWLPNWKLNGWKGSNKKPVKNRDLWEALDDAASRLNMTWTWVKGHAGDPLNEKADELANMGLTGALETYDLTLGSAVQSLLSDRGVSMRNNRQEWVEQLVETSRVVTEALDFAMQNE